MLNTYRWLVIALSAAMLLLPASAWAVSNVTITLAPGGCAGVVDLSGMLILDQSGDACDVEVYFEYTDDGDPEMFSFAIELYSNQLDMTEFVFSQVLNNTGGGPGVDFLAFNAEDKPASGKLGDMTVVPSTEGGTIMLDGRWTEPTDFFPIEHDFANDGDTLAKVPEPSTFLLSLIGLIGLGWKSRSIKLRQG